MSMLKLLPPQLSICKLNTYNKLRRVNSISECHLLSCYMGSHRVTFQSTQVNTPHINPSRADKPVLDLPTRMDHAWMEG